MHAVERNDRGGRISSTAARADDVERRVDFRLKSGTRICESCFVTATRELSVISRTDDEFSLSAVRHFGCHVKQEPAALIIHARK